MVWQIKFKNSYRVNIVSMMKIKNNFANIFFFSKVYVSMRVRTCGLLYLHFVILHLINVNFTKKITKRFQYFSLV